MNAIDLIVPAVSLALPIVLYIFVTRMRIPEWAGEVQWGRANLQSLWLSVLLSLVVSALSFYGNVHWATGMALASATALLMYTLVQSFYTDPKIRKADRGTLMLAWALAIPVSITYYVTHLEHLGWYEFGGWIAAVIFGLIIIYAPGFGASDGRSFALVAATAIPAIGFMGLVYGFLLYMVIGLTYIIIASKKQGLGITQINTISIPAVPYIILPFAILTLYTVVSTTMIS